MFVSTLKQLFRRGVQVCDPGIELLFPPQCLQCGNRDHLPSDRIAICTVCRGELLAGRPKLCRRCAMPVPDSLGDDVTKCPECLHQRLFFRRAEVLQLYRGPARQMVLRLKEPAHETLAVAAGRWLAGHLQEQSWSAEVDLVTAVPTHWLRRLVRGYHAAEAIATAVAIALNLPAATDLLYCRRWMAKQSTLLADERQANVRRAFGVAWHYQIKGCRVLLVDDVITTGATAAAASRALKQAGAAEVRVAAIARGTGEA